MFVRSSARRFSPTTSPFAAWTRDPKPGVVLHLAGFADSMLRLDDNRQKRADQLSKWLGEELAKESRDAVIASVMSSKDEARDPMVSRWLLSNQRVDSYDSTLAWDGWELGDYKHNPQVLLAHNSGVDFGILPIGEDVGAYVDPQRKALMGVTRYVSQELAGKESVEARAVRWVKAGFLRAVSVGFEPMEYEVAKDRDDGASMFVPMDFKRQALREYSVVPVPANPDALMDGRGFANMKPEDVENFAEDIERSLDGAGWLTLPRSMLEQIRSSVRGTRVQVDVGGSSFVVARADEIPDIVSPAEDQPAEEAAPVLEEEESLKCPACGYSAPSSDFGGEPSTEEQPAEEQPEAAEERAGKTVILDGTVQPCDAPSRETLAARIAAEVKEALDARALGRLP